MITLQMSVENKRITFDRGSESIVCGNSDYQIEFAFDAEWNAYSKKIARFVWCGQYFDVEFTGNVCKVPVILSAENVLVGVYAGELCTTTAAIVDCVKCILSGGEAPNPGTGENYTTEAQLAAQEAKKAAEEAKEAAASGGGTKLYRHFMTFGDQNFYAIEIICTSKKPVVVENVYDQNRLSFEKNTNFVSAMVWSSSYAFESTTIGIENIGEGLCLTKIDGNPFSVKNTIHGVDFNGDTVTEL